MGEVVGISLERMNEAKRNLNRIRESNQSTRNKLISSINHLQVGNSARLRQSSDEIGAQINRVNKRIEKIDRVIASIDYAIKRFQEVDNNSSKRIKGVATDYKKTKASLISIKKVDSLALSFLKNTMNTTSWAIGGIKGGRDNILSQGQTIWETYKKTNPRDAAITAGTYDFAKGLLWNLPKGILYDAPKAILNEGKAFIDNPQTKSKQYYELITVVTDDRLRYERIIKPMGIGIKDSFNKQVINGDEYSRYRFGTNAILNIASLFVGSGEVKAVQTGAKAAEIARVSKITKAEELAKIARLEEEAIIGKLAKTEEELRKVEVIKGAGNPNYENQGPYSTSKWSEYLNNKYGAENVSLKGTKPGDFLNTALKNQGLDIAPAKLKETWIQGGYKYEVRIHPAEADYGKTGSIYRVSRQSVDIAIGEGTGTEYMGTDGNWYHTSVLTPGKNGNVNPIFNDKAAEMTHIQLP